MTLDFQGIQTKVYQHGIYTYLCASIQGEHEGSRQNGTWTIAPQRVCLSRIF